MKIETQSLDCCCRKVCGVAADMVVMTGFMEASNVTAQESLGSPCLATSDSAKLTLYWTSSSMQRLAESLVIIRTSKERILYRVNNEAKTKPMKLWAAQALFQMAARQSWKDISMSKCNIVALRQNAIFVSTRMRDPTQSPNQCGGISNRIKHVILMGQISCCFGGGKKECHCHLLLSCKKPKKM